MPTQITRSEVLKRGLAIVGHAVVATHMRNGDHVIKGMEGDPPALTILATARSWEAALDELWATRYFILPLKYEQAEAIETIATELTRNPSFRKHYGLSVASCKELLNTFLTEFIERDGGTTNFLVSNRVRVVLIAELAAIVTLLNSESGYLRDNPAAFKRDLAALKQIAQKIEAA